MPVVRVVQQCTQRNPRIPSPLPSPPSLSFVVAAGLTHWPNLPMRVRRLYNFPGDSSSPPFLSQFPAFTRSKGNAFRLFPISPPDVTRGRQCMSPRAKAGCRGGGACSEWCRRRWETEKKRKKKKALRAPLGGSTRFSLSRELPAPSTIDESIWGRPVHVERRSSV